MKRLRAPNTPTAEMHVKRALTLLENAQGQLDAACQAICPIRGLVREWTKIGKLSDQTKAMWHHLNGLVDGVRNGLSHEQEPVVEEDRQ